MSGFFAVFSRSTAIDSSLLKRMELSLAHRGGDASGHAAYGRCGLGQVSRWTTPEQVGSQPPFQLQAPGLALVGDVRLDNRDELAEALRVEAPETLPDESLILHAYARWGEGCAAHLLGDFAFALWDARAQRLLIARDHFGMRPVYYAETARHLLVASQPRALFADPMLVRRVDDFTVSNHLSRLFYDKERSFYQGVLRLKPASQLLVDERGQRLETYWQLDPERRVHLGSSREYTERFREVFTSAVRPRLRTRGPAGVMLSGGLDSSGLFGVMRSLEPGRNWPCFSARFPDFPGVDEGDFLALLRPADAPEVTEQPVDRLSPLRSVQDFMEFFDEPLFGPNSFVYASLARRARAQGVGTMLDGLDGDSTIEHGWLFPNVLWHQGRVRRAWREIRAMQSKERLPLSYLVKGRLFGLEVDLITRLYKLYAPWDLQRTPPGMMSRELYQRTKWMARARVETLAQARPVTDFNRLHHHQLSGAILTLFVETIDHMAQALGLDHRHPYFDKRMLEFCLGLPAEQRLHEGWDRVIQRRAFAGLVPKEIQFRQSKSVWVRVFDRQFAEDVEELRALSRQPELPAYVDVRAMRRAIDALAAGQRGPFVMELWLAASVARWLGGTSLVA